MLQDVVNVNIQGTKELLPQAARLASYSNNLNLLKNRFTVTHHRIHVHIGDSLRLRALAVNAFQP